jgi:hypothetical protein
MLALVAVEEGAYAVWQELALEPVDERVQVGALNEPPAPLSLQAIEPGGEEGVALVSDTDAV